MPWPKAHHETPFHRVLIVGTVTAHDIFIKEVSFVRIILKRELKQVGARQVRVEYTVLRAHVAISHDTGAFRCCSISLDTSLTLIETDSLLNRGLGA